MCRFSVTVSLALACILFYKMFVDSHVFVFHLSNNSYFKTSLHFHLCLSCVRIFRFCASLFVHCMLFSEKSNKFTSTCEEGTKTLFAIPVQFFFFFTSYFVWLIQHQLILFILAVSALFVCVSNVFITQKMKMLIKAKKKRIYFWWNFNGICSSFHSVLFSFTAFLQHILMYLTIDRCVGHTQYTFVTHQ